MQPQPCTGHDDDAAPAHDSATAIFKAVGLAAEYFGHPNWGEYVPRMLEHLARATHASRAYVFENQLGIDGVLYTSQRHEFSAPGIESQLDNPELQRLPLEAGFDHWCQILSAGGVVHGSINTFPTAERAPLEAQDIRSLVVVPVFVVKHWWGFIGLDDCEHERHWSELEVQALRAAANVLGASVQGERLRRLEQRMFQMATHDDLTGLPNRRALNGYLRLEQARSERSGVAYCLGLFDIDRFKLINDIHGHGAGDQVLKQVALALRRSIRQGDWLGRWGGEEFLVVLPVTRVEQAHQGIERMRKSVEHTRTEFAGQTLKVTVSAGIAVSSPGKDGIDEVLARADAGLYEAKLRGRNRSCVTNAEQAHALTTAALVQRAIGGGLLRPAYQPIIDLDSRTVVGEEVLARIVTAPEHVLCAQEFIEVADRLSLLHHIDDILARRAITRCATENGRRLAIKRFINLSGDLLRRPEQVAALADHAAAHCPRLGPRGQTRSLVLQITEREPLGQARQLRTTLAPFIERGFRLAIDDFGGGYSSLGYLAELPISFIKIDRQLIAQIHSQPKSRALVASIQYTADSLGITTIAECVEDEATAHTLCDLGVHWAQGYLFSAPVLETEYAS
ncbi:putative bifunctional diguanylate cyclase/phosphodiesterase [Marichromatium bheemlicum]|uniref:EAL domain-containing protein n=1 Tax=Marichromatium bheemlicum TaxID=365339 RepID=A0ABX1I4I4_9GAMM|nr:EAL domain-containing protein [Marichromatium bheemlicum]NKN32467.1 EAL domain-containing protein [Marichromatium bheemlicum]